jgi:hypothetical protein
VVADLQQAQGVLDQALVDAADRRGREEQVVSADFSITRATNRAFFTVLQRAGKAAFSIPLDHPQFNRGGTAFVTVYEVGFDAEGIDSKSGEFTLRLTHQGNSTFRDQDGNLMNFSHRKRPTTLSYRRKGAGWQELVVVSNNLGGSDDKYLYLSPFAGWTLRTMGDDQVSWARVREIKFLFKARFIPSDKVPFGPKYIQMKIH